MEQIQNFAPVIIPTLNRYEHFKRCIESLSRCTWAEKTEVYVGLDYPPSEKYREGYEKIKNYLDNCGTLGFKKLYIIKREKNFGPSANCNDLKQLACLKSDTYISSEDDNEFSPCFLDFMNKALTMFKDETNVVSVAGYCHPDFLYEGDCTAFFSYETSSWGIGMWKYKQVFSNKSDSQIYFKNFLKNKFLSIKIMRMCPSVFNMLLGVLHYQFCDVQQGIYNMLEGTIQVRPTRTLVKNWGYDGSGINCGNTVDERIKTQNLPTDQFFNFTNELLPADSEVCLKFYRNMNVPKSFFRKYKYYLAVIRNYVFYLYRNR